MRHEQIAHKDSYTEVDIAAVWPAGPQLAPVPMVEIDEAFTTAGLRPSPAAPELASGVGGLIVGSYVMLLSTFALATVGSGQSIFAVAIAAFFMLMFFAVPAVFFRVEGGSKRPSLERFMTNGMDTLTGHTSGGAALVQMLIVPVFLTVGVVAIGIVVAIIS